MWNSRVRTKLESTRPRLKSSPFLTGRSPLLARWAGVVIACRAAATNAPGARCSAAGAAEAGDGAAGRNSCWRRRGLRSRASRCVGRRDREALTPNVGIERHARTEER